MAKLKMVKGQTYMCPSVLGKGVTVKRGDVVDVPEDKKQLFLDASYFDASNNEHHYFAEVGGTDEAASDDAPAPKSRRRTAKPA